MITIWYYMLGKSERDFNFSSTAVLVEYFKEHLFILGFRDIL